MKKIWEKIVQWLVPALVLILLVAATLLFLAHHARKVLGRKLQETEKLLQDHRAIEERRISEGTLAPAIEVWKREKLNVMVKKLAKQDSTIKKLTQELKKDRRQIVTVTKTRIKVVQKVVYRQRPSDRVKGQKHSKDLVFDGLHLATVVFDTGHLAAPWTIHAHPLRLRLLIFQSVAINRPDRVGLKAEMEDHRGKKREALIEESKTVYSYPKKTHRWLWSVSPFALELGGFASIYPSPVGVAAGGGLALSTHLLKLSYGNQQVFRFLGLGLGYASPGHLLLLGFPVSFNLSTLTSFLHDSFVTIGVGMSLGPLTGIPVPGFVITIGISTTL